ncbi:hypothetical protein IZ6_11530 [Terrihabitans soli]|uniref:DUF6968 domain-containing protein n=1 Tax=Terrihabitans soli TaxID=708113 RepID=A0A6S6QV86_9HYPH|nr:hypothetical protein [Terrihabitans soli]BCJ90418.1 hypothetical protein IZ6_11530 [Terrihabitans soli]
MTSRTDTPIATRTLKIVGDGLEQKVEIRIYKPIDKTTENFDFHCEYEIDWPGKTLSSYAVGIDPVQALQLALNKIGIELYTSSFHKERRLKWFELGSGFGFPVPPNIRDVYEGDDKSL